MTKLEYANFYEQVGTSIIPDDMPAELDPADLVIPTRAELDAKQAENKDDTAAGGADGDTQDGKAGSSGDGDAGATDAAGKGKDGSDSKGGSETEVAEAVLEGPGDNEVYQTTVEDPGEYQPKDYSFEVTIYDEDGKNGKAVKVSSVEQFEQLLDEEKNFGSASALLKAQRMATKMESAQDRDKSEHDSKKAQFETQKTAVDEQNARLTRTANELNYLVGKGKLPPVPKKYQNADWSDPEVAKQPGVKEQVELLKYMGKENEARRKLGLDDLSVSGAYAEMRLEQKEQEVTSSTKQAGEARRQASARVSATTPGPASAAPKGVMVGRNLGDLSRLSDML